MRSVTKVLSALLLAALFGISANTLTAGVGERCVEEGDQCIDKNCSGVCGAAEFGAQGADDCWCLF